MSQRLYNTRQDWRTTLALPSAAPEVSSHQPILSLAPSQWAASCLGFTPSTKQSEILDSTAQRLILCCCRQWGKSTVVSVKALHFALTHPETTVLVLSRSLPQSGLIVSKVFEFAALLDIPVRPVPHKPHSLRLPNRSRILSLPHSTVTTRGYTAGIIIVDEAAVVHKNVLAAVLPAAARTGGKLWLLSTPNGQSGLYYDIWHKGGPEWLKIRSTADECPQISREFLDEQQRLFPHTFRQEFYCEFTPPEGRLLTLERIERMVDPACDNRPRL
jgi:hypothetical protein